MVTSFPNFKNNYRGIYNKLNKMRKRLGFCGKNKGHEFGKFMLEFSQEYTYIYLNLLMMKIL